MYRTSEKNYEELASTYLKFKLSSNLIKAAPPECDHKERVCTICSSA